MATTLTSSYQLICSKSTSTYSTLRLYGKLNSQDTTNNTSSISLQARLYGNGGSGSFSSGSIKITATSGSSTTNLGSTSYSKGSEKTLKTWTTTVSHAADGSYTNKSVSAVLTSTSSPNGTASGTITVKTIPRQNTISAPTQADIGSTINIVIGKNSDSFRNTVTWTYNGSTQTIFDKVASGTYQWTVPTSIYSTIPNSQEATITLTNKTYSGSTQIGSNITATLKAKVPNSSRPTLSLNSKIETNSVVTAQLPSSANDFTKPIINLSKPRFTFTATAKDSATLTLLTVTNGNNTRTVNLSGTSQSVAYTFQNPMTNPIITFDVTDSRGLTMSTPYIFNGTSQQFVYTNPIFKTVVIKRPNVTQSTVRAEITGTYTPKQLNGSTNNKIWVGFDSREVDGSYSGNIEWYESGVSSNITLDTTNGAWSFNGNLVNKTAVYDKSYYFKVYLKDNVTGQQEFVYMLAKSVPTMSLGENDMQVNGTLFVSGTSQIQNGLYCKPTGQVNTPVGNSMLVIKRATNSEAPNNGVVLEFGNSTNWTGQLFIGDNATQGVYYNGWSNGTRGSWRRLADVPVVLYDNASGTTGNVTLSETSANFSYIEIYYKTDDEYYSQKVCSPNGKAVTLLAQTLNTSTPRIFGKTKKVTISGTSISVNNYCQYTINNNATGYLQVSSDRNTIYIVKVVGYR